MLNKAALVNHGVTPYDTFDGASITGFHAIDDGGDTGVARLSNTISYVSGSIYRITFYLVLTSGTVPFYAPTATAGGSILTGAAQQTASAGANSYDFTAGANAALGSFSWYNLSSATEYTISNISITKIG